MILVTYKSDVHPCGQLSGPGGVRKLPSNAISEYVHEEVSRGRAGSAGAISEERPTATSRTAEEAVMLSTAVVAGDDPEAAKALT